jgi:hypothetical protein
MMRKSHSNDMLGVSGSEEIINDVNSVVEAERAAKNDSCL